MNPHGAISVSNWNPAHATCASRWEVMFRILSLLSIICYLSVSGCCLVQQNQKNLTEKVLLIDKLKVGMSRATVDRILQPQLAFDVDMLSPEDTYVLSDDVKVLLQFDRTPNMLSMEKSDVLINLPQSVVVKRYGRWRDVMLKDFHCGPCDGIDRALSGEE